MLCTQHVQAITQFYFDLPNNFNLTKHTTFTAEYYDDDGEATSFIWNYTGITLFIGYGII